MHVISVMLSCALGGYVAGRHLSHEPGVHFGMCVAGLVLSMLVEVGLFMIRFPRGADARYGDHISF